MRDLIDAEVQRGIAGLAPLSQIKRLPLPAKELDHDDGEVTATMRVPMRVRRPSIYRTYAGGSKHRTGDAAVSAPSFVGE